MANRPVFRISDSAPYYLSSDVEFEWVKGMALSQQQKRAVVLHEAFLRRFPDQKILEVSGKSTEPHGIAASAFSLNKFVPSLGKSVCVENIYQSSKVFTDGGPFTDILEKNPKDAKGDERLKNSGALIGFRFENVDYPLNPKHIFYDYLYISALMENTELAEKLKQYDAFSDIAFNPQKSINCQARAAAIFVSLSRQGLLEKIKDFASFASLFGVNNVTTANATEKPLGIFRKAAIVQKIEPVDAEQEPQTVIAEKDDIIEHRFFKKGKILSITDGSVQVLFDTVGEKTLAYDWLIKNCKILK